MENGKSGKQTTNRALRALKGGAALCPHDRAWANYAEKPWSASPTLPGGDVFVTIPISEGHVPCHVTSVQRYGEIEISGATSQVQQLNLFPNGAPVSLIGEDLDFRVSTINTTACVMAPNATASSTACCGVVRTNAIAWASNPYFWDGSVATNAATHVPFKWGGSTSVPANFTVAANTADEGFVLTGFGIQIDYIGEAQDASGIVRSCQVYDLPSGQTQLASVEGQHGYVSWTPSQGKPFRQHLMYNCDTGREVENATSVGNTTVEQPCRWAIHFSMDTNDKFLVRAYGLYEIFGRHVTAVSVPKPISSASAAIKSGISAAGKRANGQLVKSIVESHAKGHPVLSKIWDFGEAGLAAVGGWEGLATVLAML